jgi:hypothetical protein
VNLQDKNISIIQHLLEKALCLWRQILSCAFMIPLLSALENWVSKTQQVHANCQSQQLPQQQLEYHPQSRQNNPAGIVINKKMQAGIVVC